MTEVILYTKVWCPFCTRAKRLLEQKGVRYLELDIEHDAALAADVCKRSGRRSVPQIFVNGTCIGGFDDMAELDRAGSLDEILGL